jgi:hypothetical protein
MSGIDVDAVDGVVRITVRVGDKTATMRVTKEYALSLGRKLFRAAGETVSSTSAAEKVGRAMGQVFGKGGAPWE